MNALDVKVASNWQFQDHRGRIVSLSESETVFDGERIVWHHDMVSISHKNVLRGIHVSPNLWKLATCVYGRIFLVVVDCREHLSFESNAGISGRSSGIDVVLKVLNENFGKWQSWTIDDSAPIMIMVPPRFGLAHLVLSKQAVFYYKWSGPYDGPEQLIFRYDDPRFGIEWPLLHELNCATKEDRILEPILSERDRKGRH